MKKLAFYALIATATLTAGCASVLNDQIQPVNVTSSNGKPFSGTIDGTPFQGPGMVPMNRSKAAKVITTDTAGCNKETTVDSSVDIKFFGNIILGGLLGSTTDAATERMWKYSDSVVVTCQ